MRSPPVITGQCGSDLVLFWLGESAAGDWLPRHLECSSLVLEADAIWSAIAKGVTLKISYHPAILSESLSPPGLRVRLPVADIQDHAGGRADQGPG